MAVLRRLSKEWTWWTWHGNPLTWDAFLALRLVERYVHSESLSEMIDASNEPRPEDWRR